MTEQTGGEARIGAPRERIVIEEIVTPIGRDQERKKAADAAAAEEHRLADEQLTDKARRLIQDAIDGKLPDLGELPPADPEVEKMARELVVCHLPEFRSTTGRKLADATTFQFPQAPRLAAWFIERGWVHDPNRERRRWVPTPGGPPPVHDRGLFIEPDEHGRWPDPDPERFYDAAEISVVQLATGKWQASHPTGLQFEADSKSEAYEGMIGRLRAKIKEARNGLEG